MTNSVIRTLAQTLQVVTCDAIIVTDEVDDGTSSGTFVREIRFFAEPLGVQGPPVLVIQVKSTTLANLKINTPTLSF